MKSLRLFLALAGLLALAACGSSETTRPPVGGDNPFASLAVGTDSTLEVMTWNLLNFPVAGDATVELVADAIRGLDVDIIAMQEVVSAASFNAVVAALDGWTGVRADSAPYDQNLAFVYRDNGHIGNVSVFEIYTHEWEAFPRSPLVLSATWDGAPFVVIDNHLKALGDGIIDPGNPGDEETRRRDACLLLASYIEENWSGVPVFTVGDWNDELTDAAPNNVFANFLDAPDSWRFTDLPLAQDPTSLKSYPKYSSQIDHILVTPELFGASAAAHALTEVVPIENGVSGGLSAYYLKISDHRPVVLRVPMPAGDAPPPGNPFAALSVGTDSTLEVATWNLEMFPVAGATTTDLVAQAIEGLDVDIVALQEVVDAAAFADLLNALDGWEGVRATSAPYDQNLAFVYRPGAHLAITSAHEIYSANAREFPRSPFVLEATWDGAPFAVINNHLKCCGDSVIDETDPWDETTRRRDACRLLAEYIELNRAGTPVITVGDWNDELTDSEAGNVFADFLNAPAAWRFVDLAIAQDPDGLHSYPSYPSHIDHILVTPEFFAACSAPEALTEVVPIENGVSGGLSAYYLKISDHRPVVLRFPMPATAVN